MQQCILFHTHLWHERVQSAYGKLKDECPHGSDIVVLYDNTDGMFNPDLLAPDSAYHLFTLDMLRQTYDMRCCSRAATLYPGNGIIPVFAFARSHPEYEYVWRIEHDVRFSGNWIDFFRAFADTTADLLATTVYRRAFRPEWNWWGSLKTPFWLWRKPELIRCFLPLCRLSHHACERLEKAQHQGWRGHEEVFVSTLLHHYGYTLEDIGGSGEFVRPGNEQRFYTNTPKKPGLRPGTFVYQGPCEPLVKPNTLYHPIK